MSKITKRFVLEDFRLSFCLKGNIFLLEANLNGTKVKYSLPCCNFCNYVAIMEKLCMLLLAEQKHWQIKGTAHIRKPRYTPLFVRNL